MQTSGKAVVCWPHKDKRPAKLQDQRTFRRSSSSKSTVSPKLSRQKALTIVPLMLFAEEVLQRESSAPSSNLGAELLETSKETTRPNIRFCTRQIAGINRDSSVLIPMNPDDHLISCRRHVLELLVAAAERPPNVPASQGLYWSIPASDQTCSLLPVCAQGRLPCGAFASPGAAARPNARWPSSWKALWRRRDCLQTCGFQLKAMQTSEPQ